MPTAEVYRQFYANLIKILPMDDPIFIAELFSVNLLPSNVKDQVKSMNTRADKAMHLLDHMIEPSLTTGGRCFDNLINVMESSEYDGIKELAKLIRSRLREGTLTGQLM